MNFEVYKDASGKWRWRLRAINNKIVADSGESYHNRLDCLGAIRIIKAEAPDALVVDGVDETERW
jgi:uncharacterized protein YegP (UPF0339 family)